MTAPPTLPGNPAEPDQPEDDLDGHTLEELSDYLDANRTPVDPSIDGSPACQIALDALTRMRTISASLLQQQAAEDPSVDDSWLAGILGAIAIDAHAGRTIPITHSSPDALIVVTEGAIRGLIRSAGDAVQGLLIGRCQLLGDVATFGAPVTVTIEVTVYWGEVIHDVVGRLRNVIATTLSQHTELNVTAIDINVRDVYLSNPQSTPEVKS